MSGDRRQRHCQELVADVQLHSKLEVAVLDFDCCSGDAAEGSQTGWTLLAVSSFLQVCLPQVSLLRCSAINS